MPWLPCLIVATSELHTSHPSIFQTSHHLSPNSRHEHLGMKSTGGLLQWYSFTVLSVSPFRLVIHSGNFKNFCYCLQLPVIHEQLYQGYQSARFYEGLDLKDLYQCKWLVEK